MARSTKKVKQNDNKEDSGGEVGQKENVNPNLPSDSGKDVVEGAKNLALIKSHLLGMIWGKNLIWIMERRSHVMRTKG